MFFRRGFGISQEFVSKKLSISRMTLSKKEKGELDFTKSEMEIYTNILKQYKSDLTIREIFLRTTSQFDNFITRRLSQ